MYICVYLFLCLEGDDTGHWSKHFFLHQSTAVRNIGDHCWSHEITLSREQGFVNDACTLKYTYMYLSVTIDIIDIRNLWCH